MPPLLMIESTQSQDLSNSSSELNTDRFASCGEGDSAPVSSSHSRRTLRTTRIRFSADSQINTIVSRDDYTQDELNACWYNAEEKSIMYEGYEKIVMRMEQGKRPKKNTTYRGLENFSETNSAQLDEIVHACIDAVMDEQDRQWQEDVFDWDLFREMSLEVSSQSTSLAYKMAEYDEREARKAYIAMAKEEHERKVSDEASVGTHGTEVTEVTTSTMAQDIKTKHHKMGGPILGRKKKSKDPKGGKKKKKSRPPKTRSSGSRKTLGDALESLNKKKVYNDKMKDREFQPKALKAR